MWKGGDSELSWKYGRNEHWRLFVCGWTHHMIIKQKISKFEICRWENVTISSWISRKWLLVQEALVLKSLALSTKVDLMCIALPLSSASLLTCVYFRDKGTVLDTTITSIILSEFFILSLNNHLQCEVNFFLLFTNEIFRCHFNNDNLPPPPQWPQHPLSLPPLSLPHWRVNGNRSAPQQRWLLEQQAEGNLSLQFLMRDYRIWNSWKYLVKLTQQKTIAVMSMRLRLMGRRNLVKKERSAEWEARERVWVGI